jgi:hypothetical protein
MTPPDYKEKAREWCPDELDHAYHGDKHACVSIATALTQADALGYARGFTEAAEMAQAEREKDFPDLRTLRDELMARALTAEPATQYTAPNVPDPVSYPSPKLDLPQEVREAVKWYAEHEGVDGQKVCESVFPALTYKAGQTLAAFIRRIAGEGA